MLETCCEAGVSSAEEFYWSKEMGLGTVARGERGPRVSERSTFAAGHPRGGVDRASPCLLPVRHRHPRAGPGRPPGLGPACGERRGQGWLLSWAPASFTLRGALCSVRVAFAPRP